MFQTAPTQRMTTDNLDKILENEKQQNKADAWNKLDKNAKLAALNEFAGEDETLKVFLDTCIQLNKLNKVRDVSYNKETRKITAIPALTRNATTHKYTLKNMDAKRVSTLKSLPPKRDKIEDNVKVSE
jgi:hypothetical protein